MSIGTMLKVFCETAGLADANPYFRCEGLGENLVFGCMMSY
jgi:hypothetical protein